MALDLALAFGFLLAPISIAGATACGMLLFRARHYSSSLTNVAVGSSVILFYAAIVVVLWAADRFGGSAFGPITILVISLCSLVTFIFATAFLFFAYRRHGRFLQIIEPAVFYVFIPLVIALGWQFAFRWTPVSGWDVLDFWAKVGKYLLLHSQDLYMLKPGTEDSPFPYMHRHPYSISLLLALGAQSEQVFGVITGFGLPWLWLLYAACLITHGASRYFGATPLQAMLCCLLLPTMPLIENHVFVAGYPELICGVILLSGVAITAVGIHRDNLAIQAAGILMASLNIGVKNTGLLYLIAPLIVLCTVAIWRARPSYVALAFTLLTLFVLTDFNRSSLFLGYPLGYDLSSGFLFFGGRTLSLQLTPFQPMVQSQLAVWVLNASFSVSGMLTVFLTGLLYIGRKSWPATYPALVYVLLNLVLLGSLFTEHGAKFAMVGSDTGHSRFLISSMFLLPLSLATLLPSFRTKTSNH